MANSILTYSKFSKLVLVCLLVLIYSASFSQELNIGLQGGHCGGNQGVNYSTVGGTIEFRPKQAVFSANTDSFLVFDSASKSTLFTESAYIKLIIGENKLRISPAFGGFVRSNKNAGWLIGLHVDYMINRTLMIFAKGEIFADYYKTTTYSHFGACETSKTMGLSVPVSIGIKYNLLHKK
jgi:hypothetical protein